MAAGSAAAMATAAAGRAPASAPVAAARAAAAAAGWPSTGRLQSVATSPTQQWPGPARRPSRTLASEVTLAAVAATVATVATAAAAMGEPTEAEARVLEVGAPATTAAGRRR
eukprot:scaffold46685_cov36-Phaeocystis_antarctica.AAC.1